MKCFNDFETRSELDIKAGVYRYSQHPSTVPLMYAFSIGNKIHQWILDIEAFDAGATPDCPLTLVVAIANSDVEFHAFNAAFERLIYHYVCHKRWGWPDIPLERWYCTMAKGCAANQPKALDNLCDRIDTNEGKDGYGKELIKKLSVPQKAVKTKTRVTDKTYVDDKGKTRRVRGTRTDSIAYLNEKGVKLFAGKDFKAQYYWNNDLELLAAFAKYNRQDVIAEEVADRKLPPHSDAERQVWLLDQEINDRGIPIDRALCHGAMAVYSEEVERCNIELAKVCHDSEQLKLLKLPGAPKETKVEKVTQDKRILLWINQRCNFGQSIAAEIVDNWLKGYEENKGKAGTFWAGDVEQLERVKEVLEICKTAGGTAVTKYKAALQYVQDDDRVRGQLLYHGAATGRWTGKGIQPHNFARKAIPEELFFEYITRGDYNETARLAQLFSYTPVSLLKSCVRGLIRAPDGRKLVVSDFAGIESRVLQWLARADKALELWRKPASDEHCNDVYLHTASQVYSISLRDVASWNGEKWEERPEHKGKRQMGKICVLALGYQQGPSGFIDSCYKIGGGLVIDMIMAEEVVSKWRQANPLIADYKRGLWNRVEHACKSVLKNKEIVANINGYLRIYWDKRKYLCIQLPSGRLLRYFKARLFEGSIIYLDGSKQLVETYGGKLVENIVQGIARCLLVNSAFIARDLGLWLIFHVHDELVAEVDKEDTKAKGLLHSAMENVPTWAAGLPLAAETYESERYTK